VTPPQRPPEPAAAAEEEDELVPVSVRLGNVVPPEDPEDWTQPMTWVAAAGMLAAPTLTLLWFWLAPPASATLMPGTFLVAASLAAGGVLTGATQLGWLRASTATVAAGLFAALGTVLVGQLMAGERQTGVASPTVALAFAASAAGLAGTLVAAPLAALLASDRERRTRLAIPGAAGIGASWLVLLGVFGAVA
jgi:hypothetical protein